MAQPEPAPSDPGTDEVIPLATTVEVSGSENITLTGINTGGGDLTVASGAPVIQGDKVAGDKVYGDKNTYIHQAPKPNPTLPAHTPHNLPERTTSAERFVGRSQELTQLKNLLSPEGSRAYLTGMGGVGKSELAIQHAYDSFDLYRGGIVRLDARQGLDAMALQVVTFFRGRFPDVPLPEDKSPTELLPVCWSQWPANANPPEPVLLILDDQRGDNEGYAAERQLLEGLPPRFRRLITQRETAPTSVQAIDLPLLKREASLELLALQAGEDGTSRLQAEEPAANALCSEVGDLPLALVLLGARLSERPDLQLGQLLADLQAKGAEAKALRQAHPELGAKLGVVEALLISWEPLNEPAKSLALLLSVLAPAVIPWELVEACRLPEQEVEEGSAFGDAQAEVLRCQFLERSGPGLYRLHPLVRQFLRLQSLGQQELVGRWRKQFAAAVAQVCQERIPQTLTLEMVQGLEAFLLHIQVVAQQLAEELEEKDLNWPTVGLARVAVHQAAFAEALKWYQLGVEQCERRLGPEHPETGATTQNNLGNALATLGERESGTERLQEAVTAYRAALEEYRRERVPLDWATTQNNLGAALRVLGERESGTEGLQEAVTAYRAALEERNRERVPLQWATTQNNLGNALRMLGERNKDRSCLKLAKAAIEQAFPSPGPYYRQIGTFCR